jgi:hypothetical protein
MSALSVGQPSWENQILIASQAPGLAASGNPGPSKRPPRASASAGRDLAVTAQQQVAIWSSARDSCAAASVRAERPNDRRPALPQRPAAFSISPASVQWWASNSGC